MCPTVRSARLAQVNGMGSVTEAGGGGARHTCAWFVDAPAVVADCRRLRLRHSETQLRQGTFEATKPCHSRARSCREPRGTAGIRRADSQGPNNTPPQVSTATAAKKPELPKLGAAEVQRVMVSSRVGRRSVPSLIMTSRELAAVMRQPYSTEPTAQDYLSHLCKSLAGRSRHSSRRHNASRPLDRKAEGATTAQLPLKRSGDRGGSTPTAAARPGR